MADQKLDEMCFGSGVVQRLLPQRAPVLMVDGVHGFQREPKPSLRASRVVSSCDPWLPGHFPGLPILPGALILEGLAQAGGLLRALLSLDEALVASGAPADSLADELANLDRGYRLQPGFDPARAAALETIFEGRQDAGMGVLGAAQLKFVRPVVPGERLYYELTINRQLEGLLHCRARAEVEGDTAAEGSLILGRLPGPRPRLAS